MDDLPPVKHIAAALISALGMTASAHAVAEDWGQFYAGMFTGVEVATATGSGLAYEPAGSLNGAFAGIRTRTGFVSLGFEASVSAGGVGFGTYRLVFAPGRVAGAMVLEGAAAARLAASADLDGIRPFVFLEGTAAIIRADNRNPLPWLAPRQQRHVQFGFAAGGGVDFSLRDDVFLRVEYGHVQLIPSGTGWSVFDYSAHRVRLGVGKAL